MNVFRDPNHPIIDTQLERALKVGKAGSVRYHVNSEGKNSLQGKAKVVEWTICEDACAGTAQA